MLMFASVPKSLGTYQPLLACTIVKVAPDFSVPVRHWYMSIIRSSRLGVDLEDAEGPKYDLVRDDGHVTLRVLRPAQMQRNDVLIAD